MEKLFKWAACDDLYARDLLKRCVDALDAYPAGCSSPLLVGNNRRLGRRAQTGQVSRGHGLPDARRNGSGACCSTAGATTVMALYGPRSSAGHHCTAAITSRIAPSPPNSPCTVRSIRSRIGSSSDATSRERMDFATYGTGARTWTGPGEAVAPSGRPPVRRIPLGLRPVIRQAPLSAAERRECYRYLARWGDGRVLPIAGRILHRKVMDYTLRGRRRIGTCREIAIWSPRSWPVRKGKGRSGAGPGIGRAQSGAAPSVGSVRRHRRRQSWQ